ncbi:Uncharacterised protein [Vibrio cholerae]|nr:Uncharacterised protein [Vibrio cholerae]CSH96703.1 Uncharacterised protein [Vibrio cholerae]
MNCRAIDRSSSVERFFTHTLRDSFLMIKIVICEKSRIILLLTLKEDMTYDQFSILLSSTALF